MNWFLTHLLFDLDGFDCTLADGGAQRRRAPANRPQQQQQQRLQSVLHGGASSANRAAEALGVVFLLVITNPTV